METIIVEIRVGITGNISDFILPAHVPVHSMIKEIVRLVEQVFPEITFENENPVLCDLQTEKIIPEYMTLLEAGIRDGGRLLLV